MKQLRRIWDTGVKVKSIKFKILEELEGYWKKLAQLGEQITNSWSLNLNYWIVFKMLI